MPPLLLFAAAERSDGGDAKLRGLLCAGFGGYGAWLRGGSFLCEVSGCSLAANRRANLLGVKSADPIILRPGEAIGLCSAAELATAATAVPAPTRKRRRAIGLISSAMAPLPVSVAY